MATFEQWHELEGHFTAIRRRTAHEHGTPDSIEFHGHELMGGTGPWRRMRGRHREAAGISLAVLGAAGACGVQYIFRGVDVARLNARFRYPRTPHAVAFGHVLEQIDHLVGSRDPEGEAIVVADEITTHVEHQRAFAGYQEFGTAGDPSSRLEHISAPLNFASSRSSDGLQTIDMALYVHFRRQRVENPHPAAQRTLARQWASIVPSIVHVHNWTP